MAASLDTISTPKRQHSLVDRCCLCGFSFLEIFITGSGRKDVKKYYRQKLRINEERQNNVKKVINISFSENDKAVCTKCYRKIESVIRQEDQITEMRMELQETRNRTQDISLAVGHIREKRLLRSPAQTQPLKVQKFPTLVCVKHPVQLTSFLNPTTSSVQLLAPASVKQLGKENRPGQTSQSKTTRKSLCFDEKQTGHGEVEVIVNYPSGKKSAFMWSELHKSICKGLLKGNNCEKIILDLLAKAHPMMVVETAAVIIRGECKCLCKKNSESSLRSTDYAGLFSFTWEMLYSELEIKCPGFLKVLESAISDIPIPKSVTSKLYTNMMVTATMALHNRSQEMSAAHYLIGFVLANGGCTQKTIERLSKLGLSVRPETVHRKLQSWNGMLDNKIIEIKNEWLQGGRKKYQLVGDNWDKDILPSYRTSDRKTESLHLFNVYAIVDRVIPNCNAEVSQTSFDTVHYIPSVEEQELLMKELIFIFATAVIEHIPQMHKVFSKIYPTHLKHKYSDVCGKKTEQYPLGLFDCNENRTNDVIQLLKQLTDIYVPIEDGEVFEAVFFGGDRLTDERVQCAQMAMKNAESAKERLEGFISKIEDFHRLMNFLEAIFKLTYSMQHSADRGTASYYRNLLNYRNAKGDVKNAYRAYKMLYHTILDAILVYMFLDFFDITEFSENVDIPVPENFNAMSDEDKMEWLNDICGQLLKKYYFEDSSDICASLREVFEDSENIENYWVSNKVNGRFKCHFCDKTYARVTTLKTHESKEHGFTGTKRKSKKEDSMKDELQDYILMLFKLVMLHKNLDTAVDMGDGERCVRSAKYELPVYNKTNKVKYAIGSIQLTALAEELLPAEQQERFIANRFVNVQGGKNSNIALDEYLEMLNRDSKLSCSGYKTKNSIINHSREYPLLTKAVKYVDEISNIRKSKGFHHTPEYKHDVLKIAKDLFEIDILNYHVRKCSMKNVERNPFDNSAAGLVTLIHRHRPPNPYRRLRDPCI